MLTTNTSSNQQRRRSIRHWTINTDQMRHRRLLPVPITFCCLQIHLHQQHVWFRFNHVSSYAYPKATAPRWHWPHQSVNKSNKAFLPAIFKLAITGRGFLLTTFQIRIWNRKNWYLTTSDNFIIKFYRLEVVLNSFENFTTYFDLLGSWKSTISGFSTNSSQPQHQQKWF